MNERDGEAGDADLVTRFVDARSAAAFETIVRRHAGWVWAVARRRLRDEHAADDVTQAVFMLLASRGAAALRDRSRLAAWLARATHRTAAQATREAARRGRRERVAARPVETFNVTGEDADTLAELDDAIVSLGEADRDLIVRRYYRGESLPTIAAAIGASPEAARKRVGRAVARLRRQMPTFDVDSRAALAAIGVAAQPIDVHAIARGAIDPSRAPAGGRALFEGVNAMLNRAKLRVVVTAAVAIGVASAAAFAAMRPAIVTSWNAAAPTSVAAAPAPTEIWSEQLLVRLSSDGRQLIGYSVANGTWEAVSPEAKVDAPAAFKAMVVATNIAAGVADGHAIAFGAAGARWDVADAPGATSVIVSDRLAACITSDNRVLAFSDRSGKWAVATLGAPIEGELFISSQYVWAHAGGKLFVFSAATGKWAEPMP